MDSTINYGLKALIAGCRLCALPDCDCKPDLEEMRTKANNKLDSSHKLDEATFNAIYQDLDQHRISDRPAISAGDEKQRDDGNFERAVEEAFKDFRDQERDILLNAPAGFQEASSGSHEKTDGKWWLGAAHLRHHLELLLVLKGIKPCVLFHKYSPANHVLFSTLIIDCLVPIMDRLDLWSYGFGISIQTGNWVFYDARSPLMPLVDKIFLTHHTVQEKFPAAYPTLSDHRQVALALGYPVPFDDFPGDRWIYILDTTETDVLISKGQTEPEYCVHAMIFQCPLGGEADWVKVLDHFDKCEEAALSVGTDLQIVLGFHPEMKAWVENVLGLLKMMEEHNSKVTLQQQDDSGGHV